MPILWPTTLPVAPLVQGYSEGLPNNQLRSSMSAGPPKVRRKAGLVPWPMAVSFLCTSAQAETLMEFAHDTLMDGVLRFEWTHPRTGATVEVRMAPSSEKLVDLVPNGGDYWQASFMLEVLP